jgi:hypothetical protein
MRMFAPPVVLLASANSPTAGVEAADGVFLKPLNPIGSAVADGGVVLKRDISEHGIGGASGVITSASVPPAVFPFSLLTSLFGGPPA